MCLASRCFWAFAMRLICRTMDLLGYSDTVMDVCLRDKSRRDIHDILRVIFVYPRRVRVCPCVTDPWVRKTLGFLDTQYSNEPSHK
jgi:hypothetical protein